MDLDKLKAKWDNVLLFQDKKGYKALRISSECKSEFFIAVDAEENRCLLLFLPTNVQLKLNGTDKEKLQLTYIKAKDVILIKLNDIDFVDLFNDLIISLYSKIHKISDPNSYSKELISSFYKWVEFFDDKQNKKLGAEEIQGLFGELFVLKDNLIVTNNQNINSVLESWRGPYDNTNDFVLDKKNVEVKTKQESKSFVKISSEYQLDIEFDKGLELLVVSVVNDVSEGESIFDLLIKIIGLIRANQGDLAILYHALNQKGLTIDSVKEYNNHRFIVKKTTSYDCTKEDFPKLSISNIPEEITKLKYQLRTTALSDFLIEEKKY
jgi:hypothetical protein